MKQIAGIILFLVASLHVGAQEFIPLWPKGKMPNSKGLKLKDSIANERVYRVGTPGMYAFLPSAQEASGGAVLICPGGGYERLAYVISGLQLAKWFNTMGVAAFVLNYRLPGSPDLKERQLGPVQDAQRAMRCIRAHAAAWGIDTAKIGVQGSSAGGHLAATLGTFKDDVSAIGDSLDRFGFRPAFMLLVSPVISLGEFAHAGSRKALLGDNPDTELVQRFSPHLQVDEQTPPAFLVHAYNDKSVSQRNSLLFYEALIDRNIPASLHIFPQGGHAIALRHNPGSAAEWTTLCELWLQEMGFMTGK